MIKILTGACLALVLGLFALSTIPEAEAGKNFVPAEEVRLKGVTFYRFRIAESEYGPELSCITTKKGEQWRCRLPPWSDWSD